MKTPIYDAKQIDPGLTDEQADRTNAAYRLLVRRNRKQIADAALRSNGDPVYVAGYYHMFMSFAFNLAGHGA